MACREAAREVLLLTGAPCLPTHKHSQVRAGTALLWTLLVPCGPEFHQKLKVMVLGVQTLGNILISS